VHAPPEIPVTTHEHIVGYCLKCRKKVEMKKPHHHVMKNLKHAVKGVCPKCGVKMVKFG
jgi:Zn finger protein HypA/HybF involved in hydrogenase expression